MVKPLGKVKILIVYKSEFNCRYKDAKISTECVFQSFTSFFGFLGP